MESELFRSKNGSFINTHLVVGQEATGGRRERGWWNPSQATQQQKWSFKPPPPPSPPPPPDCSCFAKSIFLPWLPPCHQSRHQHASNLGMFPFFFFKRTNSLFFPDLELLLPKIILEGDEISLVLSTYKLRNPSLSSLIVHKDSPPTQHDLEKKS